MITHFTKRKKPKPSIVFDTYWKFACERQEIFFKRLANQIGPWTNDSILQRFKFTNVYRATDRVSQYLIKNVIYSGEQSDDEVIFRILLFKLFNKIETWRWLEAHVETISWRCFDLERYVNALDMAKLLGKSVYSGAYIMASPSNAYGQRFKHENHLYLLQNMMNDQLSKKIRDLDNMESVFHLLKSYPSIGDFLAYQYAIDINYSEVTNFSEMQFVMPGPGARDGIRKCFMDYGEYSEQDIIRLVAEEQEENLRFRNLRFLNLLGRPLQLIDCQNLFCEVDKYSRKAHPEILGYSGRSAIKQKFSQNHEPMQNLFLPPKWNILTD